MSAIEKRVIEWIQRHRLWDAGQSVLIGVSGGIDSMVMMTLLARTRRAHKGVLKVMTFNHGLREASQIECQHVLEHAEALSIPALSIDLNLEKGPNLQARARAARQDAFLAVGSDRVATAHHQEDQAETVLYRLLRGSGTIGLSALSPLNTPWCRPILCLAKSDIRAYAAAQSVQWYDDPSNQTSVRGRIRDLIPLLDEIHGGSVRALVRSAQICAYDDSVLSDVVEQNWAMVYSNHCLLTPKLLTYPAGLQLRFLYRFFMMHQLVIRFERLERILVILNRQQFSKSIQLDAVCCLSISPEYIQIMPHE